MPAFAPSAEDQEKRMRLRRLRTMELTTAEIVEIRRLLDAAFGDDEEERFTEADWDHSVGGVHFVLDDDGSIVSHASVVERELHIAGQPFRTGYVEAVAKQAGPPGRGVRDDRHARRHGVRARDVRARRVGHRRAALLRATGLNDWAGPSNVRTNDGERRTLDEDGYIMVLLTPRSATVDRVRRDQL